MKSEDFQLHAWQHDFVQRFACSNEQRNVLIAAAGTGKTLASFKALEARRAARESAKIVILTDMLAIGEQWRDFGERLNFRLETDLRHIQKVDGASLTYQSLKSKKSKQAIESMAADGELILVIDEAHRPQRGVFSVCDELLSLNTNNQCLFVSQIPLIGLEAEWTYEYGLEHIVDPQIIHSPSTQTQIVRYAPSLGLLDKIKNQSISIEDLKWRDFEVFVSQLLESDGYEIELMQGTKDGGVDVIGYKDLGEAGIFKTLWQAKKYKSSRKVQLSTIRELADVRHEHSASKAIIVTSSFLTRGALERVYRDKHILGKVDKDDLDKWVHRKLFEP